MRNLAIPPQSARIGEVIAVGHHYAANDRLRKVANSTGLFVTSYFVDLDPAAIETSLAGILEAWVVGNRIDTLLGTEQGEQTLQHKLSGIVMRAAKLVSEGEDKPVTVLSGHRPGDKPGAWTAAAVDRSGELLTPALEPYNDTTYTLRAVRYDGGNSAVVTINPGLTTAISIHPETYVTI